MNLKHKEKFYLQTWFIAVLFGFWFIYGIPLIIGIILLIIQTSQRKQLLRKYGDYDYVTEQISNLNEKYESKDRKLQDNYASLEASLQMEYERKEEKINKNIANLKKELDFAKKELASLNSDILVAHYNFSDYDGISSEECKNKLSLLKETEKGLLKDNAAVIITSSGSKKEISDNSKQILRCFNTECDNVLINLSVKNIDAMRKKITNSFESLNKIFSVDGMSLSKKLLEYKLEELNLVYTYELKRQQEFEQQKAIKEQMVEEEKVRREIEKEKAKLEKDQTQCSNEIKKLISYMQKTENDIEKKLYIDKINELENKLKELETKKEDVLQRETNARAGFVYVISNLGSFGKDVYKIGMTRRLEPMDRIKELSSASVPFEFDVHAMIFSDDAPSLENTLHKLFEKNSVNRVNLRKEFFKISIDDIEKAVKDNFNNTVTFTQVPVAKEYHQTLSIIESELSA